MAIEPVLALLLSLLRGHEGIADDAGDQTHHREAADPRDGRFQLQELWLKNLKNDLS